MAIHLRTRHFRPVRRGLLARAFMAAWLSVQLAVVGGVPLVDASVAHTDNVVAHWEDADDTNCPPLHETSECQLCQQLTTAGRHPGAPRLLSPSRLADTQPPAAEQERTPRAVAVGIPATRAPPTA